MTRVAACDLGSNSVKLLVAEVTPSGLEVLDEDSVVTRVGEGLDQRGSLLPAAMDRTLAQLKRYAERAQQHGVERIRCVATAGLRGAKNAPEFLSRAQAETGIEIEIIDGLREAALSFRAPAEAFGPGPVVVVDVGGRSTEIITGSAGQIEARVSLEIGSVRITERFFQHDPPSPEELAAASLALRELISTTPERAPGAKLVGVSGTVIALLGLQLGLDEIKTVVEQHDGAALTRRSVESSLADFLRHTAAERIRGTVLPAGRADVIVAGALIVLAVLDRYGASEMLATQRGVRYGLIYELAGR